MTSVPRTGEAGPVPRIGRYEIDTGVSSVTFRTRHMFGLGGVTGTFTIRHGVIDIVEPVTECRVEVDIDAASFHTGNLQRDARVRSAHFLDAARHPSMRFASTRLDRSAGGAALAGTLTVCGVTAPVSLVGLTIEQPDTGLARSGSFVADATTRIDRTEFGVTGSRGMTGRYLDVSLRVVCVRR